MAALALMTAACSNSDNDILTQAEQPAKAQGIPFTATISIGESASTRALTEDGSGGLTATWAAGDKVALIHNGVNDEMEVESVSGGVATIKGTITSATDGADVTVIYPATAADGTTGNVKADLLYAQSGATLADVAANYDVRKGTGTLKVNGTASLNGNVSLTNQFAIFKFTTKNSDASADISISSLTVTIVAQEYVITPTSATSELFVALPATTSSRPVIFSATGSDSKSYTCSKYPVTFAGGKYYQSTLKMQEGTTAMWYSPFMGDGIHMLIGEGYTYNDVTLKGNGTMHIMGGGMSFMDNGDCTFNVPDGKKFKSIVISGDLGGFSGTGWSKEGELGDQIGTWTGDAKSVGFNIGGLSNINLILFTVN